jgi:hypothetical protein
MIDPNLRRHLEPVLRRVRSARFLRRLMVLWLALAGAAVLAIGIEIVAGISLNALVPVFLLAGVFGVLYLAVSTQFWTPDLRGIARRVEQANPQLNSMLLTAVEQKPDPITGEFSFLQLRLVREAVGAAMEHDWSKSVTGRSLNLWRLGQFGTMGVAAIAVWMLYLNTSPGASGSKLMALVRGIEVTPGNVRVEKGSSLVVLVRFSGSMPPEATLVYQTGANTKRIALSRNLSDPVFGGTIPEVKEDALYRIEYRGKATEDYRVQTFEHPRLNRADADIRFPAYTRLGEKQVPDTRRISAVEGSAVSLELLLNKQVRTAQLIGRDKSVVDLAVATNRAAATLTNFALNKSQTYELNLVDAEGLTNRVPTQFVLEAIPNRPPQTKWISPKGDQRPSALQELTFSAESQDDFGLMGYGFTIDLPDGTRREVRLAGTNEAPADAVSVLAMPLVAGGNEKRTFSAPLSLEKVGAMPSDLLSWHVWAEDIGPDGLVRRTDGDLFFGEVRPFEEIFRQAPPQDPKQQQQQQQPQGSPASKLADLQKQIINATWKLIREETGAKPSKKYGTDVAVVADSQQKAREQAGELPVRPGDAAQERLAKQVVQSMDEAIGRLDEAKSATAKLTDALVAERAAYQALLKLAPKETQVTQGKGGGGGGGGQSQEQLDQLELSKSENRYETRSQAQQQRSPEQQESLDLLNRLKELAERQQDINEKLQEMQNALAAAKTEEAREEARRQLKRLQEEQRDLLAEADAARQQTERSEQPDRFAQERKQLEQTREDMQKASDALQNQEVSRALSSGTRAERQLAETRDELRRRSAGQFTEEMRRMRSEARDLAERQQQLTQALAGEKAETRRSLSDTPDTSKLEQTLEQQRSGLTNLVQQMRDMTREAEATEPLLAKGLYETLREHRPTEVEQEFDFARQMIERTFNREASLLTEKTGRSIDSLRKGVERAAENVLGDEADSLRQAQSEIDDLAQMLRNELAAAGRSTNELADAGSGQPGQPRQGQGASQQPSDEPGQQGQQAGQGQQGQGGAAGSQGEQAKNGQPGEQPGQRPGQQGKGGQDGKGKEGQGGQGGQGGRQASTPGQGKGQGAGQSDQPSDQPGQGSQPGRGQGQGQGQTAGGGRSGGGGQQANDFSRLFNQNNQGGSEGGGNGGGPITGEGYRDWVRRLSNVEEMVGEPQLREELARVRDRVRGFRTEFRNGETKPHWDMVSDTVLKPLLEVRARVAEELAKKQSREAVVPIDRDPVPVRYSEAVRKYYERLGKEE